MEVGRVRFATRELMAMLHVSHAVWPAWFRGDSMSRRASELMAAAHTRLTDTCSVQRTPKGCW